MASNQSSDTGTNSPILSKIENDFARHLQEPLLATSILVFLITILKPVTKDITILYNALTYFNFIILAAAIFFIYQYFKSDIKNYSFIGIPALMLIVSLFSYHAMSYLTDALLFRDFTVLSIAFAFALLFWALSTHKIIKLTTAIPLSLFIIALFVHLTPALSIENNPITGKYLQAFDPYWYYQFSDMLLYPENWKGTPIPDKELGYIPEHEYMNYPPNGLDWSKAKFMLPFMMASFAAILGSAGTTLFDSAMLYPAIFSAFVVLVMYLLMRELFYDMRPYNHVVALIAAFALIFIPAFAAKSAAGNCEDDTLGMFLLASSFLLFVISMNRKNFIISLASGAALGLLATAWSGYGYGLLVMGAFTVFYAVVSFVHKKNCVNHLIYFLIPVLVSILLMNTVLHSRSDIIGFSMPGTTEIMAIGGAVFVSIVLEMLRVYLYGESTKNEQEYGGKKIESIKELGEHINIYINRYIYPAGIIAILGGLVFIAMKGPMTLIGHFLKTLFGAQRNDVVGITIAEVIRKWYTLEDVLKGGYGDVGILFIFGLCMIPVLLYLAFVRRNIGSMFVLAWAIPMIIGVIQKPVFGFSASVPIVALGATIGLFAAIKKDDLMDIRILPTVLILLIPLTLIPLTGAGGIGNAGLSPMHMGPSVDRYYWDPALQWLGNDENTNRSDFVLTWWDYGHWINPISYRPTLIDNLQANYSQLQEVARFFVNKTSEEDAMGITIVKDNKPKYAVIDWTLIGKSAALHEIATGDLSMDPDKCTPDNKHLGVGDHYAACSFLPGESQLTPQLTMNPDGSQSFTKIVVFGCGMIYGAVYNCDGSINYTATQERIDDNGDKIVRGFLFHIKNDESIAKIEVVDYYQQRHTWEDWTKDHDASVLGIQPFSQILQLALNRPADSVYQPYRTIVYLPDAWQYFMMTRLYLGEYMDDYMRFGLCKADWCGNETKRAKHFERITDYNDHGGYVRMWRIYTDEELDDMKRAEEEAIKKAEEEALKAEEEALKEEGHKEGKPWMDAYVMSHCPYGLQMEKALIPVKQLLGDKADINIKYVSYAMHGKTELDEQTRQYCINKLQEDIFWNYLKCFVNSSPGGDAESFACMEKTGVDKDKVLECVSETDAKYNITGKFNDKSTWSGGRFPLFPIHEALNKKYGVGGSPTVIINGEKATVSRSPEAVKEAICGAFEDINATAAAECSVSLSNQTVSAGFGLEGTGSASDATCG